MNLLIDYRLPIAYSLIGLMILACVAIIVHFMRRRARKKAERHGRYRGN